MVTTINESKVIQIWNTFAAELDEHGTESALNEEFGCKIDQIKLNPQSLFQTLVSSQTTPNNLLLLGALFNLGVGTPANKDKALELYEQAANLNDPRAQYVMGTTFELLNYGRIDEQKAYLWFDKAARGGHFAAQFAVADCYAYGRGTALDAIKCFYWDTVCAKRGNPGACSFMGHHCLTGYGTQVDTHKALRWFRIANEKNQWTAKRRLRKMFYGYFCISLRWHHFLVNILTYFCKNFQQSPTLVTVPEANI